MESRSQTHAPTINLTYALYKAARRGKRGGMISEGDTSPGRSACNTKTQEVLPRVLGLIPSFRGNIIYEARAAGPNAGRSAVTMRVLGGGRGQMSVG